MNVNYWQAMNPYIQSPNPLQAQVQQEQIQQFEPCPQPPGTLLRVFIPAGTVINLLNLLEVSSPSGICLIVRIPALGGAAANGPFQGLTLDNIIGLVHQAGGNVQFM